MANDDLSKPQHDPDTYGRIVRDAWVVRQQIKHPGRVYPAWEDMTEFERETDRQIAKAVLGASPLVDFASLHAFLVAWHAADPPGRTSWLRCLLDHCEWREAAIGKFLARFDGEPEDAELDLTNELDALRDDSPDATSEAIRECRELADAIERAVGRG